MCGIVRAARGVACTSMIGKQVLVGSKPKLFLLLLISTFSINLVGRISLTGCAYADEFKNDITGITSFFILITYVLIFDTK